MGLYNPSLIKIWQRIREIRVAKGFSQEKFAADVGLDRTYVCGVERRDRNMSVLNLLHIAKTLKIEVGELISQSIN